MEYTAHSTAPTPVSLTQHAYFNPSADERATIGEHTLHLPGCSAYCPDDGSGDGVPTGELRGRRRYLPRSALAHRLAHLTALQAADTPLWPYGEQYVVDAGRGGATPPSRWPRCTRGMRSRPSPRCLPTRVLVGGSQSSPQSRSCRLTTRRHCATGACQARHKSLHDAAVCLESHRPQTLRTCLREHSKRLAMPAVASCARASRTGKPQCGDLDCISTSDTT